MTIPNTRNYNPDSLFDHLERGFNGYFRDTTESTIALHFVNYDGILFLYSTVISENELVTIVIRDTEIVLTKSSKIDKMYNLQLILESLAEYITNPPVEQI